MGGVQQKEADKGEPRPLGHVTVEGAPYTNANHGVGNQPSASAGNASGSREIFCESPNDRSENSAAIQRKTRQKIENREPSIGPSQPASKRLKRFVRRRDLNQREKYHRQKTACQRSGDGD